MALWLETLERQVRKLHRQLDRPVLVVAIDERSQGATAHAILAGTRADAEFAAKTILGEVIAAIGGPDYQPGACPDCGGRLARSRQAFALLWPDDVEHVPHHQRGGLH